MYKSQPFLVETVFSVVDKQNFLPVQNAGSPVPKGPKSKILPPQWLENYYYRETIKFCG